MVNFAKVLSAVFFTLLGGSFLYFLLIGYPETVNILKDTLHNTSFLDVIKNIMAEKATPVRESYYFLLAELGLLTLCCGFILFNTKRILSYLKRSLLFLKVHIISLYEDIRYTNLKYILVIPLVVSGYYVWKFPVIYDEALTYLAFVKDNPYQFLFYYPEPNNHIFYSLLVNIVNFVPGLDILYGMRLISVSAMMLSWLIVYRLIKSSNSDKIALLVTGISSCLYFMLFFSSLGRGYSFSVLFFIICLYAAVYIVKGYDNIKYWSIFTISAILGFYTMPSFLYSFISINLFILLFNPKAIKSQIYSGITIILITLILYIPVFIVSGLDSVIANHYVAPLDRMTVLKRMTAFVMWTFSDIFGVSAYIALFATAAIIAYSLIRKDYKVFVLWIIFCGIPFLLLIIHSVIPYSRTFLYLGFVVVALSAITFRNEINKYLQAKILLPTVILIQIASSINYAVKVTDYQMLYGECGKFTETVLENEKSYYVYSVDGRLLSNNIRFEIARHGYNSKLTILEALQPINADSVKGYDYVIIDKSLDTTTNKQIKYTLSGFRRSPMNVYIYP